jgi:hypothetical protein
MDLSATRRFARATSALEAIRMAAEPEAARLERHYGETAHGRVAHIYRELEDLSLCGFELIRGVTEASWRRGLCRSCERLAS